MSSVVDTDKQRGAFFPSVLKRLIMLNHIQTPKDFGLIEYIKQYMCVIECCSSLTPLLCSL